MEPINILILNCGSSLGIKSYGPRCLLKVSSKKTILDKQLEALNKVFKDAYITVTGGFKADKIKEHLKQYKNIRFIENKNFEETNDLFDIRLFYQSLILDLRNNLLIIPGNILFKEHIFKDFNLKQSQIFLSKKQKSDIGCIIQDNNIENLMWGLDNYWLNIGYFTKAEHSLLQEISQKSHTNKYFMFEAINYIIQNGGKIKR